MSENKTGEIVIYQTDDGQTNIDVRFEDETVWLTQAQLVELYQSSKANISEHIKHIFEEGELEENSVVRNFRTTAADGKSYNTKFYNLDMIISLGYRVKSKIATNFRRWATEQLKEYLKKGFLLNDRRLKEMGGGDYWHELLDRIRDIRSSEKAIYRQVLDLYATSVDYDPKSKESIAFFKMVQNKLHYAAHGHTAAEVQAIRHNPMHMSDYVEHLDKVLTSNGEKLLEGAGNVSHKEAIDKALEEYRKYQVQTLSPVEKAYLETIKGIERKAKNKKC